MRLLKLLRRESGSEPKVSAPDIFFCRKDLEFLYKSCYFPPPKKCHNKCFSALQSTLNGQIRREKQVPMY